MTTSTKPYNKPLKSYNVTPKPIHYRVAKNLIDNGGHKGKALVDAGYSKVTAQNPKKILETKSFIDAMNAMGLSDDYLNGCLLEDIKAKPKERLGELTLAYKLKGKLKDTVQENKTLILITSGESATRYNVTPTPTPRDVD